MPESKPKLSVVMITYNHEKYIEQAVRGALMQETDFEYEIIIGEDCSTDRTREVLIELQKQYPDKIKLVLNPDNLGMISNSVNVLNMAQGQYIALLEGDDYWISPYKLQRQVDYLEAHPDCKICTHDAYVVDLNGRIIETRTYHNIACLDEYFESKHFVVTSSVLIRAPHQQLPQWFLSLESALDWPLYVWLLMNGGNLRHLQGEPMSSWRVHEGGVASFMTYCVDTMSNKEKYQRAIKRIQRQINDQKIVQQMLPNNLKHHMHRNIFRNYETIVRQTYGNDKNLFNEAYAELCRLSPGGKYIPSSPRLLSIASCFLGYPQAEWLSGVYRQSLPLGWRKKLYKT